MAGKVAARSNGDQLNHHPHLHSLVSGMAWHRDGVSTPLHGGDSQVITRLFQHHVLEMLVSSHRLSRQFADKLRSWRHSGFQVCCGPPVGPQERPALERLAACIVRPRFAASRLHYEPHQSQAEYRTAKGVTCSMDALDWIALVTLHIPAHHEQMLRYYGRYSNAARGKGRKKEAVQTVHPTRRDQPSEADSPAECFPRQRRRNWARLLRKIYVVDPLTCDRCGSPLEIISSIEQPDLIRRILDHPLLDPRSSGLKKKANSYRISK